MIASSRKKTDKRDAYWIAKALASGMTPHPVYIPNAKVRVLRNLLSMRKALTGERNRWQMRARSTLRAAGVRRIPRSGGRVATMRVLALSQLEGLDAHVDEILALCQRQQETASLEIAKIEARLRDEAKRFSPAVSRRAEGRATTSKGSKRFRLWANGRRFLSMLGLEI